MFLFRILTVAIYAFLLSCCCPNAFAGNDSGVIKLELPDAAAVGMGGAFTGEADRPSAVYYNPAGIVQIVGPAVSAGLTWLQPQVKFESLTANNGGTSEMKTQNFFFPDVFVTTPLIADKLYLGLGETSDFGGGVSWEANSFTQYATIKTAIADQDYRLVGAYKVTDQWSLGVGATDDQSHYEHDQGLQQASGNNGDSLFKANGNAWGFDLATLFKLNDQNQFGLDYKSPIHHTYNGNLYLNGLDGSSTFGAGVGYSTFFGGSSFQTKAIQKLTLPQSVTLGYSAKPTSKLTVNFDLEWTDWSQYKQQTTSYPDVSNANQLTVLGTGNPQARDWTSVWSESLGVQYAVTDNFRVRAGYSHHQTPVPESTMDAEFPDGDSNTYTAGIGYDITKNLTLDIAYVADFYQSRNVVNTVDTTAFGAHLSGKYSAFVNVGTMSLTYKF